MFAPETFIVRAVDDGMAPRVNAGDCLNADADAPAAVADSSRNRKAGRGNGRPAAVDD